MLYDITGVYVYKLAIYNTDYGHIYTNTAVKYLTAVLVYMWPQYVL